MSRWTPKVVSVDISLSHPLRKYGKGTPAKGEHLAPLENSIDKIASILDDVNKEQKYLRVREQTHRDTQESTFARVYWFSLVESIVLVVMSVLQIIYLRRLFYSKELPGFV
eukprot:TRINITY_DN2247_c0_g1_i3.p1 TRINITY_DN2247_c0_g1~~TRINITY_DN2247_c0_g1_i3.p1  ORF type:complete len:111 (-),score=7.44 TRINITY_DN2247_c0_g1_i3:197-529(-)